MIRLLPDYLQQRAFQYRLAKLKRLIDPVPWIEQNVYLYDTGNLITLYDCQRRPLELALSRDASGNFKYNTILWSWPKKSAKSSVIASVADYVAETRQHASVKLVANDLKQADSRVGYYLRESILIGQKHGKRQGITVTPSGYKVTYPNASRIECVPIDPSGEAGGNDDLIVYSELWGWKSKAHQRMWSEMTLSPNKFGNSQRWIDTYAGFRGESPILEQLYETGVTQGKRVWDDLEVYINDAARMLAVWVTKPMFPWQTEAYYASEAAQLVPSEFERMHRNQWADATAAFVPIEWFAACKSEYTHDKNEGVIIAVDAATTSDCFAIVMVSRRDVDIYTHYVRTWIPPHGGTLDFREPEAELRRLCREYNVMELAYDSYQLHDLMSRLRTDEYVNTRAFPQAGDRLVADKRLYDLIRERRMHHHGEPDLMAHVGNAAAELNKNENTLRIVKREQSKKIDACVSLSMASHRAFAYAI